VAATPPLNGSVKVRYLPTFTAPALCGTSLRCYAATLLRCYAATHSRGGSRVLLPSVLNVTKGSGSSGCWEKEVALRSDPYGRVPKDSRVGAQYSAIRDRLNCFVHNGSFFLTELAQQHPSSFSTESVVPA